MAAAEDWSNDFLGVLAIHNLAKSYKTRKVVEDVSLHVRRGEAVGLLGPNGAGKTTVFYMITGLMKPDSGMIELDGYDVTPLPMYRRARLGVGYLPQEASMFRGLSRRGQYSRGAGNHPARRATAAPGSLEALLDEFELKRLARRRRLALGRRAAPLRASRARSPAIRPSCCSTNPSPASTRSRSATSKIWCCQLKARGIGVLITDHCRETLGLIDRAYIIHTGHVLTKGDPRRHRLQSRRPPHLSRRGFPHVTLGRAGFTDPKPAEADLPEKADKAVAEAFSPPSPLGARTLFVRAAWGGGPRSLPEFTC